MALPEWFHELAKKVNNWGRWGPDDEIGTINLITPDLVRNAAGCVKTGKRFALALPLSEREGIQLGFMPGRINPLRTMVQINNPITGDPDAVCTSDDVVVMGLQCATHWDGLGHVSYADRLWNGFPASTITASGASKCGIHKVKTLIGRGVLLDVARAKGLDRLASDYAVTADDLDAACELGRVNVGPGDIVLVRTGQTALLPDKMAYSHPAPGLSFKTVEWFHAHDTAAVATDTLAFEIFPPEDPNVMLPVHLLHLVEMGMTQGQNWALEALAADCADDGVYEFLLDATPQPFTNAVGSPVNPVAVK
jgi:kynurenine formamidase